jgi:UDP-N-acetylmuramoyl-tripeptide--D-alanyl-D-alanine ligase
MTAAIKVLAQLPGRRRIAVLGDMYELGIYEEQGHKAIGQTAFNENIDLIVAVGKLGKLIGMGAIEAGMVEEKVVFANTNELALRFLVNFLEPDDIVLVKGSRGMKMEGIVQGLMG